MAPWRSSPPPKTLIRTFEEFADNSTLHSFALYRYPDNSALFRWSMVALGIATVVVLPAYVTYEAVKFYSNAPVLVGLI